MYGALWRMLPGPRWLRALVLVALAAGALVLLFTVVFPYLSDQYFSPNLG